MKIKILAVILFTLFFPVMYSMKDAPVKPTSNLAINLGSLKKENRELIEAILLNNLDAALKALEAGADINGENNLMPLHLAIENKALDIFRLLVTKGADLTLLDSYGCTILHKAVSLGDLNLVKLLFRTGFPMYLRDLSGDGCLGDACPYNYSLIEYLVKSKGEDINSANSEGLTLLHKAVRFLSVKSIAQLLHLQIDVNKRDNYGRNCLFFSQYSNTGDHSKIYDVAKFLIDNGADVNACDAEGISPLHDALSNHLYLVAQLLIECGANLNAVDKYGNTPLHMALKSLAQFSNSRDQSLVAIRKLKEQVETQFNDRGFKSLVKTDFGALHIIKLLLNRGVQLRVNRAGCNPFLEILSANCIPNGERVELIRLCLAIPGVISNMHTAIDIVRDKVRNAANFDEREDCQMLYDLLLEHARVYSPVGLISTIGINDGYNDVYEQSSYLPNEILSHIASFQFDENEEYGAENLEDIYSDYESSEDL